MKSTFNPREVAAVILAEKNQGRIVPTSLEELLRDETVDVEFFSNEGSPEGRLELCDGKPAIFVNTLGHNRDYPRVRFTFAHEIGHYYLHRHLLRKGHLFRDQRIEVNTKSSADPIEREANEFASEILLPSRWVDHELSNTKVLDLAFVLRVADAARVSIQATSISLMRRTDDCACVIFVSHDGIIEWTAVSADWIARYLPWKALVRQKIPLRSVTCRRPEDFRDERVDVSVWAPQQSSRNLDLYESAVSTPFGRMVFLGADVVN